MWPSCTKPKKNRESPTLAKPSLGNTNFSRTKFGQHHILVLQVGGRFGLEVVRVGPKGGPRMVGPQTQKHEVRRVGPERWGFSHVGSLRLGPEGRGGPKYRAFFPLQQLFFSFFPLLGVFSWNFGGFFLKAGTLKCARLEFSCCRVKPRQPQSRPNGAAKNLAKLGFGQSWS